MADFGWYALPILGCFGLYLLWMFLEALLDDRPASRNDNASLNLAQMYSGEIAEIERVPGVPLGQISLALPSPIAASLHETGGQRHALPHDTSSHAVGS